MAMTLEALGSYVHCMLMELAADEVGMLLGVSSEIQSMENKLRVLKDFFADADRRSITDESVRNWVAQH